MKKCFQGEECFTEKHFFHMSVFKTGLKQFSQSSFRHYMLKRDDDHNTYTVIKRSQKPSLMCNGQQQCLLCVKKNSIFDASILILDCESLQTEQSKSLKSAFSALLLCALPEHIMVGFKTKTFQTQSKLCKNLIKICHIV